MDAILVTESPGSVALSLSELQPGERGEVVEVASRVGDLRRRLLEMGFVPGTSVRVVRLAPLRDPMEIELHGYHISLRRSDARSITVQRGD